MIDEIFDRQYQAGRAELNAALAGRLQPSWPRSLLNAFKVLNRIEYSAPWAAKARRARSH